MIHYNQDLLVMHDSLQPGCADHTWSITADYTKDVLVIDTVDVQNPVKQYYSRQFEIVYYARTRSILHILNHYD